MGDKELQTQTKQQQIQFVNSQFRLSDTVSQLHKMMHEVCKDEINPKTVNAACNCVHHLNKTIDMAIKAAEYLSRNE